MYNKEQISQKKLKGKGKFPEALLKCSSNMNHYKLL